MNVLCLDVGGTNPRIAMLNSSYKILSVKKLNKNCIIQQINDFLYFCGTKGWTTNTACIAVAGIVEKNESKTTNSNFKIKVDELKQKTMLSEIYLINDFVAIAEGYLFEFESKMKNSIIKLYGNNSYENVSRKIIIGPGTGLGTCFIFKDKEFIASEGGHIPVCLDNKIYEMIKDISKDKEEHFNFEHFVSGKGLRNISIYLYESKKTFEYFCDIEKEIVSSEHIFSQDESKLNLLLSENYNYNKVANMSFNIFMYLLGSFCQICTLFYLTEKIVFAGGILPKNQHLFSKKYFLDSYKSYENSQYKNLLEKTKFELILDYDISLYGCLKYALNKSEITKE